MPIFNPGSSGGVSDGDKGDITVSGSGATWSVDSGAVAMSEVTKDVDLAIADGGTGQSTAVAAFDALAPTTTQGDLLYHNGTNNVRLAKGTELQQLRMNSGATAPEWFTSSGGGPTTLKKTAPQTINAGAGVFTDVTDLTFAVTNGTDYAFQFYIVFRSTATATGHKVGVNCPTGTLSFFCTNQTVANSSTAGVATWLQRHSFTRDDMTLLTTTVAANEDLVVLIQGRYLCTADGTFAVRFANELGSNTNITVEQGSWGMYF